MRKNYSQEQRAEIISSYLSGKTITRLNSELGISRSTLYKWIAESTDCQQHDRKINMREFINLKHQCEQQQKMIEILQNAPCTVIAPLSERYEYILNSSEKYSINLHCKTMKVAKGSYYNHIFRNKNENTKFEEKKRELTLKDLNIKQSFSNPGNPFNNSVMESFFKSMKTEKLYRTDFKSEREFRIAVKEYIEFYNEKRPHSVLRYRTPNKFEEDYIRKQAALQNI